MSDFWYLVAMARDVDLTEAALMAIIEEGGRRGWRCPEEDVRELRATPSPGPRGFSLGPLSCYVQDHTEEGRRFLVLGAERWMFRDLVSDEPERRREGWEDWRTLHSFLDACFPLMKPLWAYGSGEWSFRFDRSNRLIPPSRDQVVKTLRKRHKPWLVYLGADLLRDVGEEAIVRSRPKERRQVADGALLFYRTDPFGYGDEAGTSKP